MEISIWHAAFAPLVIAIYLHNNDQAMLELIQAAQEGSQWHAPYFLTALVWLPFLFLRERMGGGVSWGKKMMGLDLARSDESDHPVSAKNKIIRNLILIIPIFPLVEYFAAYYGNNKMQRIGDKMGGSYVIEADIAKPRTGSYSTALLGAFIGGMIVYYSVAPSLTEFWFKTLM